MQLVQHFFYLDDEARNIKEQSENDMDDEAHQIVAYFTEAPAQIIEQDQNTLDNSQVAVKSWIADLFSVLDNADFSMTSTPFRIIHVTQPSSFQTSPNFSFVFHSLLDLKHIRATLLKFSNTSANQHFLLDTGAPRSICSKDWIKRAHWDPL